jgi:hypothetical protein
VISIRRSSSPGACRRQCASRRLALALGSTATLLVALLLGAAPAGAVITGSFGVQERKAVSVKAEPLQYHKGPIIRSSDSYAVYWDPFEIYNSEWMRLIDQYFQNVGSASGTLGDVFSLNAQYGETGYSNSPTAPAAAKEAHPSNQSTFRGAYTITAPYPATECTEAAKVACVTDTEIQHMLKEAIKSGALPGATGTVPGAASTPVYYVLTPPGVTVCTGSGSPSTCSYSKKLEEEASEIKAGTLHHAAETGICGYHSWTEGEHGTPIVYAVQPWIAGDAGLYVEEWVPLKTSETSADVLACQDDSVLEEPNQLSGLNSFANYGAGLADVIVNGLSIEQNNIVVDPLLNGWYQTATEAEQGDACQRDFGPPPTSPPSPNPQTHAANLSSEGIDGGAYYVQWAYNSSGFTTGKGGGGCWSGTALEPHFTAPNPVNAGDVAGFDAEESSITLDANTTGLPADEPYVAPIYKWEFGDGTKTVEGVSDASEFHAYKCPGTYSATLTVTDGGGNVNSTTQAITVDKDGIGESGCEEAGGGKGSGGSGSGGSGSGGSSSGSGSSGSGSSGSSASSTSTTSSSSTATGSATPGVTAKPPVPNPVAAAATVSKSLSQVLRSGLVVRYSVNEQVAGRFEVLLASSIAKRIGLHGAPVTGLPQGTAPQIVIAKAILVTTKGGRSTIKIVFGKTTAARLRRLGKVSLMLRLIVRNASSQSPTSTTVISTVNLGR